MKNKYIFTAGLLVCLTVISVLLSVCFGKVQEDEDKLLVVASFYPVYIAACNVTEGIDGVTVRQLSQPSGGCVHDYQLTTQDMLLLEKADILIINGAGMESYLTDVMERYPHLDVIDTSEGAKLLESGDEHNHDGHSHEDAEHEEEHKHLDNAHIWLDMDNYCIQIGNIGNKLSQYDKQHESQYKQNGKTYITKVQNLKKEGQKKLMGIEGRRAVSTHEAFSYFALNFDWTMEHTVNMDENTSLSAAQVGEVIEAVQQDAILYVFTEEIYGTRFSKVLEEETDAKTVILDTLVSGEEDTGAYLEGMRRNIDALWEVAKE